MSLWANNEDVYEGKLNNKTVIVSSTQPTGVQEGQLWYDTSKKVLKTYDGAAWHAVASADNIQGDFVPDVDNQHNVGSASKRWVKVVLSGALVLEGFCKVRPYVPPTGYYASYATPEKVKYSAEQFDTLNEYDPSAGVYRYTASRSGYYFIYAQCHFDLNKGTDDGERLEIRKNGTVIASSEGCLGSSGNQSGTNLTLLVRQVCDLVYLSAGDYIEVWLTQWNSGTNAFFVDYNVHESHAVIFRVM